MVLKIRALTYLIASLGNCNMHLKLAGLECYFHKGNKCVITAGIVIKYNDTPIVHIHSTKVRST